MDEDSYLFSPQSTSILRSPDRDSRSTRSGDTRDNSGTDIDSACSPSRCDSPPSWKLPLALPGTSKSVFISATGCPDVVTDIDQPEDSVHDHTCEQPADPSILSLDDLLAMFDVCSFTQGDCSTACNGTIAQQRICALRQVGATISSHAPLFEHCIAQKFGDDRVPEDIRGTFLRLEHSLAKAATARHKGCHPSKGHSVRKRFGNLRRDFAAILGIEAIHALALLTTDTYEALTIMKIAVGSFFLLHPELAVGCAC